MHRRKLTAIMIDCDEATMEAGTRFWSQALGMPQAWPLAPDNPYVMFRGHVGSISVGMQRIGSPSRIHLDIESDNVDAEAQRLEDLGARRLEHIDDSLWIMEDPAGMPFCVTPPHGDGNLEDANVWND